MAMSKFAPAAPSRRTATQSQSPFVRSGGQTDTNRRRDVHSSLGYARTSNEDSARKAREGGAGEMQVRMGNNRVVKLANCGSRLRV